MSKRAKLLLRENNELEEQIRDEAARAALTQGHLADDRGRRAPGRVR